MPGCSTPNCTIDVTGSCYLENDPDTCPARIRDSVIDQIASALSTPGSIPAETNQIEDLPGSPGKSVFYPGLELGLADARTLASKTRVHLIGILGAPDAGKTALAVSMYLLLSKNLFEGYRFANCRSLIAFEQLARGTRRWEEGKIPSQLTAHTKLEDPRSPGFLHLRVRNKTTDEPFDLLLPDLPGEWTDELIDDNERERLEFLRSAHAIWLMVDGRPLANGATRKYPLGRLKLLLGRIAPIIPATMPIYLVVTRRDEAGEIDNLIFKPVLDHALELGLSQPEIIPVASFSDDEKIGAGFGLPKLIDQTLSEPVLPEGDRPAPRPASGDRHFVRHRLAHG